MPDDGSTVRFSADGNPLQTESASQWHTLVESVNPAGLLLIIEARMSAALLRKTTPEDILQESLLQAWRDRARCEWKGLRSFRAWLLSIILNRIRDAADHEFAQKRGGDGRAVNFSTLEAGVGGESGASELALAIASTTPSRVAIYKEQAAAIRDAMDGLPAELRDVLRLRLIDQLTIEETAGRLGIGPSAARHRFRKGAEMYRRRLRQVLSGLATTIPAPTAAPETPDSAT